ncbi:hypothetical protein XENOCAPTIV_021524 [Xenoophorus captivus]|uniref:Uncharacterized protein n=1 Tax=Xenoophorus captivus TaxID=1517983 RepID=A0ABV0SD03_9TELE
MMKCTAVESKVSIAFTALCASNNLHVCAGEFSLCRVHNGGSNRVCKKGYRRCVNGRCVGHSSWCNGQDDCGDNSDEVFCNSESTMEYFEKVGRTVDENPFKGLYEAWLLATKV